MDVQEHLDDIAVIPVPLAELQKAKTEEDFVEVAFNLLKEAGDLTCTAGCIIPDDGSGWDRNHAILGGHVVRLFKLICATLDQTQQHRRETLAIFMRPVFETSINLIYLAVRCDDADFDSYVSYSMQHERKLYDHIKENVKRRAGEASPIEKRMLNSIEKTARNSGYSLDQKPEKHIRNWGGKNLYEKAKFLGFEDWYLAAFGGPSHNVHGNWMDLLEYHLEYRDGGFHPGFEWSLPRPQYLFAATRIIIEALGAYVDFIGHIKAKNAFDERLSSLSDRVHLADQAHEDFLNR